MEENILNHNIEVLDNGFKIDVDLNEIIELGYYIDKKSNRKELKKVFSNIDIKEDFIYDFCPEILDILLKDRTTENNIIWATDDYEQYGEEFKKENEIKPELITKKYKNIIQPRYIKEKNNQSKRTKERAEVFTPSWVCNKQNNLVDNSWFGRENIFNFELNNKKWRVNNKPVKFSNNYMWKDYVKLSRMEITCGEAPYLVSRYDTVTGKRIDVKRRIGLLDRKLRIINENVNDRDEWIKWTKIAYQNIYGFEFQGDNVLLAREALLGTFYDNYFKKFNKYLSIDIIKEIAEIISWNIWQMDGLTLCSPYKTVNKEENKLSLEIEGVEEVSTIYSKIKNWDTNEVFTFVSLTKSE